MPRRMPVLPQLRRTRYGSCGRTRYVEPTSLVAGSCRSQGSWGAAASAAPRRASWWWGAASRGCSRASTPWPASPFGPSSLCRRTCRRMRWRSWSSAKPRRPCRSPRVSPCPPVPPAPPHPATQAGHRPGPAAAPTPVPSPSLLLTRWQPREDSHLPGERDARRRHVPAMGLGVPARPLPLPQRGGVLSPHLARVRGPRQRARRRIHPRAPLVGVVSVLALPWLRWARWRGGDEPALTLSLSGRPQPAMRRTGPALGRKPRALRRARTARQECCHPKGWPRQIKYRVTFSAGPVSRSGPPPPPTTRRNGVACHVDAIHEAVAGRVEAHRVRDPISGGVHRHSVRAHLISHLRALLLFLALLLRAGVFVGHRHAGPAAFCADAFSRSDFETEQLPRRSDLDGGQCQPREGPPRTGRAKKGVEGGRGEGSDEPRSLGPASPLPSASIWLHAGRAASPSPPATRSAPPSCTRPPPAALGALPARPPPRAWPALRRAFAPAHTPQRDSVIIDQAHNTLCALWSLPQAALPGASPLRALPPLLLSSSPGSPCPPPVPNPA
eukprot:COSAG04_NODE_16_length_40397_cov_59.653677_7_plen_555_part_00